SPGRCQPPPAGLDRGDGQQQEERREQNRLEGPEPPAHRSLRGLADGGVGPTRLLTDPRGDPPALARASAAFGGAAPVAGITHDQLPRLGGSAVPAGPPSLGPPRPGPA